MPPNESLARRIARRRPCWSSQTANPQTLGLPSTRDRTTPRRSHRAQGALEPRIHTELGEASETITGTVRHVDAADIVRRASSQDRHGHEQLDSVDDAKGLAAVDLLSGVEILFSLAYR